MKGYIYKYTFPNSKVYIGQTRRPIDIRHREHLNPSTGPLNSGFWEAYQTVGTPELSILETIESSDVTALVETLNQMETAYIYQEKATDPKYGYNKKKTATASSPDIKILNRVFEDMCKQAEKDKEPFFDSLTEKLIHGEEDSLTEEEKAFVKGYVEEDNSYVHPLYEEMIPDETSVADEEFSFIIEDMMDHAIWLYNEETREIIGQYIAENSTEILRKAKQGKIIQQLDKEGNVIHEYESPNDIMETFNIRSINNITNVLKGKQNTAYGFFWRYKQELE